jgi:hypothetical protein
MDWSLAHPPAPTATIFVSVEGVSFLLNRENQNPERVTWPANDFASHPAKV